MKCNHCKNNCIKAGKQSNGTQKYYCKTCHKYQQATYKNKAYLPTINKWIIRLIKEGCGIRSIARLLAISTTTVLKRILFISRQIKPPAIPMGKTFEVDELRTYIRKKTNPIWVAVAMRTDTREVVLFSVGRRTKTTLKRITDTLLLAHPKQINTDRLNIYSLLIPSEIHNTRLYNINHVERQNLTLRTHLKPLSRRTICFSKSIIMLTALVKIYFWG